MQPNNFNFSCPPPPLRNPTTTGNMRDQRLFPLHQQWNGETRVRPVPEHFYGSQLNTYYRPPPVRPHGYNNALVPREGLLNNNHFMNRPSETSLQTNYKETKSKSEDLSEPKHIGRKQKKNGSNCPTIRNWSIHEAEQAFNVEKQYNNLYKNHSLIIKFPDPEISKEIIEQFHNGIESIYFPQPTTPRFCFVTLKESADADAVITSLNKQVFGNGHLIAEHKKDREDDYQYIGPEDIVPITLYVGNLSRETTKRAMEKLYPRKRRIDIGFAKRLKSTRYATVRFHNVKDAIAAFKETHSKEMYNRSLIVRFLRLHETTGVVDETMNQNPPKSKKNETSTSRDVSIDIDEYCSEETAFHEKNKGATALPASSDVTDYELAIKPEPSDNEDRKPNLDRSYISPFLPGPIDNKFVRHKPKIDVKIKTEIKAETDQDINNQKDSSPININDQPHVKQEPPDTIEIKEEPHTEDYDNQNEYGEFYNGSDSDDEEILDRPIDFDQLYQNMAMHRTLINSVRKKDSV